MEGARPTALILLVLADSAICRCPAFPGYLISSNFPLLSHLLLLLCAPRNTVSVLQLCRLPAPIPFDQPP